MTRLLYDAIWSEYCDWGLEFAKVRLSDESLWADAREATWWTPCEANDIYLTAALPGHAVRHRGAVGGASSSRLGIRRCSSSPAGPGRRAGCGSGADALAPVPAERGVLANDQTPEGRPGPGGLRALLTSQLWSPWGSPGTVDLAADGSFQLHLGPADAGNRDFSFTYKACPIYMTQYSLNGGGCSDDQTVEVAADPTRATDDVYDMPPDSTVLATTPATGVLANDPSWGGSSWLTWKVLEQPRHGNLVTEPYRGTFTYTPDASFTGTDSFTYIRCAARNETVCPSPPATVTIRRASVPRVVSISAPSPTSGDPFVIELSEPVRGVDGSRVQLRAPGSSSPVEVSYQCQAVLPPSAEWSFGTVITSPCGPAVVANRIVVTPTVPLVSPALYTVVLNPTGTAMPGVNTGLQLPRTERTIAVTAPQGVAPQIVQQPEDLTVRPLGDSAVFSAPVLGNPQPIAQWQVSSDGGGSWSDLPTKLGATLVVRPEDAVDGDRYRVTFSNQFGSVTSRVATLAVGNAPVVTLHPTDRTNESLVTPSFSFTAAADGIPAPSVQWEESTDSGRTWADLPGETSTTLTRIGAGIDGALYRARFSNNAGTVRSNPAEVFVYRRSRSARRSPTHRTTPSSTSTASRPSRPRSRAPLRPACNGSGPYRGRTSSSTSPTRPHRPSRSRVTPARRAPGSACPSATPQVASTRRTPRSPWPPALFPPLRL